MAASTSVRGVLGIAVVLVAASCSAGLDGMGTAGGPSAVLAMAAAHGRIVPAAARLTVSHLLPRAGWTATASDSGVSPAEPARNVLDGNAKTMWHSRWTAHQPPFPHFLTIDTKRATQVSGLIMLPRQDGNARGRISRYRVYVVTGGRFRLVASGTWADDGAAKRVDFATASTRYVRLIADSEVTRGGTASEVAELNLLGPSTTTPVTGTPMPRTGWTATASDAQAGNPATAVLDGLPTSFWHSRFSPSVALPHSITLDLGRATTVRGLTYLPRQDGNPNGRIGRFQISVSATGTAFGAAVAGGTWADTANLKSVGFPAVTTRYVRLTALSEAGDRGPWTSAAEINLLGTPGSAPPVTTPPVTTPPAASATAGSWGPVIGFPLVPVSAVLLPDDKLLTFSAYSPTTYSASGMGKTETAILDLKTGIVSQELITDTGQEMFCSGIAVLPDGRVLVNGGSDSGKTSIYDPGSNSWSKGPVMNIPRAYEGDVTLSTGQVFTLGGSWADGAKAKGGKNAEVYTPDGSWSRLPDVTASSILTADPAGVYRSDNQGWFFATADGGVFHAGPSRAMSWITTAGNGSSTAAGTRGDDSDAMNGNAVLYDVGKIFTDGGATAYENAGATSHAYTIDINGGPSVAPVVTRQPDMSYARAFQNSVVLPDGKVLVIGGQPDPVPFTDTGAVMTPELWDPVTGRFTLMARQAVARNYHSVAVLLPDGRVFSGGGGLCGDGCATNHPDGQIFTPPYLINRDGSLRTRPTITSAPSSAQPGQTLTVTTGGTVSSFVLVRTGAVTHTVDSDQRRIPLQSTSSSSTRHELVLPSSTGTVVPGNYMLFALDAAGTPSVSTAINIQ